VKATQASPSRPVLDAVTVQVTDGLMAAVRDRLAAVPPERGGAILACGDLLYLLVEDTSGRYSGVSWDISSELSAAVGQLEAAGHGTLAGTVHTHPAGVPDPSGTDVATMRHALDLNPHLDHVVIGVVTEGFPREHDLPVGERHRMSLHLLRREASGLPGPRRAVGNVVLLGADLAMAGILLESATETPSGHDVSESAARTPLPGVVRLNRRPRLAVPVPGDRPAALFIDPGYPQTGPIAVVGALGSDGTPTLIPQPSPWDPVSASGPQLAALAVAAAGRRITGSTERAAPLVGPLGHARVLIAGAGSVGSKIAEDLVRSGVGTFTIIDPDPVEPPNLSRTVYAAADIGIPKPDALAARLRAIDPAVQVSRHVSPLGLIDLGKALDGISLVVAATDDMGEQAVLAHHAYAASIPLVACALYRAAAAGEVVISVPAAETACWSCAVGASTAAGQYRPERDYGLGGRLVGEAALGPSIHLVTSVASSVALGLLAGPDSPAGLPLARLLAARRTLGLIATSANWDFFSQVFAGMDHQYAPQSVWVRVERSDTCPVCGPTPVPPLTERDGAQLVDAIAQLRNEVQGEDFALPQPADQEPDPDVVDSGEAPNDDSRPSLAKSARRLSLSMWSRLGHVAVALGRATRRLTVWRSSRG
jgi:molybdopterin/thiamine biosynthesis adenylyltransferase